MKTQNLFAPSLFAAVLLLCHSALALEPETLFDFQVGVGTVTDNLVEGPDGNFYGTTAHGGPSGNGTVFRVTPGGMLTTIVSNQANPAAGLVVGNDGLLYGMVGAGGPFGWGTAFKMTTNGIVTNFAVLDGTNGGNPQVRLVMAPDGNFYGTSQEGGDNQQGALFKITPAGVVTRLRSFTFDTNGSVPMAGLTVGPDGELYGITTSAGAIGAGTIFKITTSGAFTVLHSFQNGESFVHQAALTLGPDGNLYGTGRDGGTSDFGCVFKVTTNGTFSVITSFAGTNGSVPLCELTVGADGQLYGTTELGGAGNFGTVFKVTTNGALTTLASFPNRENSLPNAGLILASDGNFYGCSQTAVYKVTPTGVITSLTSILPLDGLDPQSALTLAPDGNFYGTTDFGGTNNSGTIFRISPDGVFTRMLSFNNTDAAFPQSSLTLGPDGNLYGATTGGGTNGFGSVFRFSTNGLLTTLAFFDGPTRGIEPRGTLLIDTNGNIFGTTPQFGPGNRGTIFRIAANGDFTTLASFNTTNGSAANDGITPGADGNFYSTTSGGGANNQGTVFRMTPAGVLTTLFSFNMTNGTAPVGGLVSGPDGLLYGTTAFGGTNLGFGTIFKITTNGDLTTLFTFSGTNGEDPSARLIFGPDGKLYGTASFGGSLDNSPFGTGSGTVFSITTNGVFTTLVFFQGTNGANPAASLAFGPDGNLYGTTAQNGQGGGGTIFRIVLGPRFSGIVQLPDLRLVLSATGPAGNSVRLWTSGDAAAPIQSWTVVTNSVFDSAGTFSYTNSPPADVQRYFRLSVP
jgi:uncharacterized repeat protein (TIGR03803 family)